MPAPSRLVKRSLVPSLTLGIGRPDDRSPGVYRKSTIPTSLAGPPVGSVQWPDGPEWLLFSLYGPWVRRPAVQSLPARAPPEAQFGVSSRGARNGSTPGAVGLPSGVSG